MFTPPKTYNEFYDRYPNSVRGIAGWCLRKQAWDDDALDELEQEFHLLLIRKQVIEKFDVARYANNLNVNIYFSYIKQILLWHHHQMYTLSQTNSRAINDIAISLDTPLEGENLTLGDVLTDGAHTVNAQDNAEALTRLRTYLSTKDTHGHLVEVYDQLLAGKTRHEIEADLRISYTTVCGRIEKIHKLARTFLSQGGVR
jgi:hypothetical protein